MDTAEGSLASVSIRGFQRQSRGAVEGGAGSGLQPQGFQGTVKHFIQHSIVAKYATV